MQPSCTPTGIGQYHRLNLPALIIGHSCVCALDQLALLLCSCDDSSADDTSLGRDSLSHFTAEASSSGASSAGLSAERAPSAVGGAAQQEVAADACPATVAMGSPMDATISAFTESLRLSPLLQGASSPCAQIVQMDRTPESLLSISQNLLWSAAAAAAAVQPSLLNCICACATLQYSLAPG
jgi:hypothetical protein